MILVVEASYHQKLDKEVYKRIKGLSLSKVDEMLNNYKKELEDSFKEYLSAECIKIDVNLVND